MAELKPIYELEDRYLVLSSKGTKYYEVSLNLDSCTCLGFKFRRSCRHIQQVMNYLESKSLNQNIKITPGENAAEFVKKHGEAVLNYLKMQGNVIEKGNRLFPVN